MGQTFLHLENHSETCVLPVFSPKGTFNISKIHAAFCPNLKHNLMQTHHSLQCAIFGGTPTSQMDQYILVLNKNNISFGLILSRE